MAIFTGTAGRDTINASSGNDSIDGLAGDDRILTGDGEDSVDAGPGDDQVNGFPISAREYSFWAFSGRKIVRGGLGNDFIVGGSSGDLLQGDEGQDTIYGRGGADLIAGGSGADDLDGGDANDTLRGEAENDSLNGGLGHDLLEGGTGNDTLYGEDGNDTLDGGGGIDELHGGLGDDIYLIGNATQYVHDSGGFDTAYVSASFVKLPTSIERVVYSNGAQPLPYWIDALLPDEAAGLRFRSLLEAGQVMRYAFPTALPAYETLAENIRGWAPLSSTQQARVVTALRYVESVVDLHFMATTVVDQPNVISFANNDQTGSAGFAYYPSSTSRGSDLYLDSSNNAANATIADGSYAALTLIHEIGHALGLEHPFSSPGSEGSSANAPHLSGSEDATIWTVMSYADTPVSYQLRYSALDIAALHYLYGPSKTARAGADAYSVSSAQPNFIWDGGGIDSLSAVSCEQGCTIYLTPGYWGYVGAVRAATITSPGQITVNFGTLIENLIGSNHPDHLVGNEMANSVSGGSGHDSLEGGAGNDTLLGELGHDLLAGGAGDDMLVGGSGTDTAVFTGPSSRYELLFNSSGIQLHDRSSADGTDTVFEIERLQFENRSVIVESRAHASFADLPRSLYQFFILAFGAAPGVEYLQQCADAYRGGADVKRITNVFCSKSQFTDIYPVSLSNSELARKLVDRVVGSSATVLSREEAIQDITVALNNGLGRGDMIYTVFSNLAALRGDAKWGGTAQLFSNQVAVARYYTEVMNQSTTDLTTLTAAISAVSAASDASSDAAILSLVGMGLLGG